MDYIYNLRVLGYESQHGDKTVGCKKINTVAKMTSHC